VTTFTMPHQDMRASDGPDHFHGHGTGVCTPVLEISVLGSCRYGGTRERLQNRRDSQEGRKKADIYDIASIEISGNPVRQGAAKRFPFIREHVHFPVSVKIDFFHVRPLLSG